MEREVSLLCYFRRKEGDHVGILIVGGNQDLLFNILLLKPDARSESRWGGEGAINHKFPLRPEQFVAALIVVIEAESHLSHLPLAILKQCGASDINPA